MQPLSAIRTNGLTAGPAGKPIKRDPAPSRWAYRAHRLWLTPLYRRFLRTGLPLVVGLTAGGWYLSDPAHRDNLLAQIDALRSSIESRPEFSVNVLAVEGASPVVERAIRGIVGADFPVSSFELDLDAIQLTVSELDVIKEAAIRIRPGGVLEVAVVERVPALLWRTGQGIELLDATGHRVASITERGSRPDLPLIAGAEADAHVDEALAILAAGRPIASRMRGLVRVGERRWDVVLDRDQRILLPETGPVAALEQVLALDEAQDLLERDITHIDMRNPARPTLRLTPPAVDSLRRIRSLDNGEQE